MRHTGSISGWTVHKEFSRNANGVMETGFPAISHGTLFLHETPEFSLHLHHSHTAGDLGKGNSTPSNEIRAFGSGLEQGSNWSRSYPQQLWGHKKELTIGGPPRNRAKKHVKTQVSISEWFYWTKPNASQPPSPAGQTQQWISFLDHLAQLPTWAWVSVAYDQRHPNWPRCSNKGSSSCISNLSRKCKQK